MLLAPHVLRFHPNSTKRGCRTKFRDNSERAIEQAYELQVGFRRVEERWVFPVDGSSTTGAGG
jgi:hypothetical protein